MADMSFIRFPDIFIDRKEESFYNEGCSKKLDTPIVIKEK